MGGCQAALTTEPLGGARADCDLTMRWKIRAHLTAHGWVSRSPVRMGTSMTLSRGASGQTQRLS
jgi:hypothetical protein